MQLLDSEQIEIADEYFRFRAINPLCAGDVFPSPAWQGQLCVPCAKGCRMWACSSSLGLCEHTETHVNTPRKHRNSQELTQTHEYTQENTGTHMNTHRNTHKREHIQTHEYTWEHTQTHVLAGLEDNHWCQAVLGEQQRRGRAHRGKGREMRRAEFRVTSLSQ